MKNDSAGQGPLERQGRPLADKLRDAAHQAGHYGAWSGGVLLDQAADEIDRLRAIVRDSRIVAHVAEREEQKRWERERQAKNYATTLAIAMHAKHYPEVTQWKPLPDTLGLLTQIDNMVSVLVRPCACHPDDNPPKPCAKRYALSECRAHAAPDFPFGGTSSGGLTQCDMHDDESS